MCEINYFIKLLTFSTNDNNSLLLYGFCCATNQGVYDWKEDSSSKKNRSIWKSILNEDKCKVFLERLTEPGELLLSNKSFTSPQLLKRNDVLSNDRFNERSGPIKEYRKLTEFWNTHKKDLYNKIIQEFERNGIEGKELYYSTVELFDWVNQECGINMRTNGYRLGNFEFYHPLKHKFDFIIEVHKECDLLKSTVKKMCNFNTKLIVNCFSKYRECTISNQTKIFLPEKQEIEFTAKEPMAQVVVQIWDEESGELIFSKDYTLMMEAKFGISMTNSSIIVSDPWSKKLIESASNKKDLIENDVQKVTPSTSINTFSVDSDFKNGIDVAIEEGLDIFSAYHKSYEKGAFIKNIQKDGEIQSFIKILEYMNHSSVKNVIIADPFFSITAASKILARISNRDIQVEVITSLCKTNSDNGEVEEINQSQKLQKFLEKNTHILHPKLLVWNLTRGGKQVFHDRYLIRYHKNGKIDGFLLSNSLNSMGQFYPFVIAPMDYDVCLEVMEYLNEIRDSDVQKKKNKKKSIISEILYDSKKLYNSQQKEISEELPYMDWFAKWVNTENIVRIPEDGISEAISIVMKSWADDGKLACKMLCFMGLCVESYSKFDLVAKTMQNQDYLVDSFLDEFISLSKEEEYKRTHSEKGIESKESRLFMLLNGNAIPSRSGFSKILENVGHIWYGPLWLYEGYNILLYLTPERYIELLETTKSPLMFDILLYRLSCYSSLNEWFPLFIEKGSLCVQVACTDSILQKMKLKEISFEQCKEIMTSLSIEKSLIPEIRLISEIVFYIRTGLNINQDKWNELLDWLMNIVARDISSSSKELQKTAIHWLNDCEVVSNCKLHFDLANYISDSSLKNNLLKKALNIAEKDLIECSYYRDIEQIGKLYIELLEALYEEESVKQLLKRYVHESVFETATEPELKNYDFDRWNKASIRAEYQLQILYIYGEMNPDSQKVKEYIEKWEKRINKSEY